MAHVLKSTAAFIFRENLSRPAELLSNRLAFPRSVLLARGSATIALQAAADDTGVKFSIDPGDSFAYRVLSCVLSIQSTSTVNAYAPQGLLTVTNPFRGAPAAGGAKTTQYELHSEGYALNSGDEGVVTWHWENIPQVLFLAPENLSLGFSVNVGNNDAAEQPIMAATLAMYLLEYDIEQYYSVYATSVSPVVP